MKRLSPAQIIFLIIFPIIYMLMSLFALQAGFMLAFSTERDMSNDAYNKPALAIAGILFMIFCPHNYFPKAPVIAFCVGAILLMAYKLRWKC